MTGPSQAPTRPPTATARPGSSPPLEVSTPPNRSRQPRVKRRRPRYGSQTPALDARTSVGGPGPDSELRMIRVSTRRGCAGARFPRTKAGVYPRAAGARAGRPSQSSGRHGRDACLLTEWVADQPCPPRVSGRRQRGRYVTRIRSGCRRAGGEPSVGRSLDRCTASRHRSLRRSAGRGAVEDLRVSGGPPLVIG